MSETRNWRDAKIPQWVKDSVEKEISESAIISALSWPTESKPIPLPFRWVEYDKLHGEPVAGKYWALEGGRITEFSLRPTEKSWKRWEFCQNGQWSTTVQRGELYATKREALLALLWNKSRSFAEQLWKTKKQIEAEAAE